MKKFVSILAIALLTGGIAFAQYEFKDEIRLESLSVGNQARTGTCWCFATTSFLESELIRQGKGKVDLSEMFSVRMTYIDKAQNYILRQGQANFSQGSLAHDVLNSILKNGIQPQEAYKGLVNNQISYDHKELSSVLKGFLDGVLEARRPGKSWKPAYSSILDAYMGVPPETFIYGEKEYDARSFADFLEINVDDYISITSFSHHPFHKSFILEIPDNYSNGYFLNLPLDEFMDVVDHALENGYSMSWDGDGGEKGFRQSEGLALLPVKEEMDSLFKSIVNEIEVNQENRQENFESFRTTDDHLMHLVGRARDQDGRTFYIIKNSWGKTGPYDGYLYMSEAYFRMKTISVMLHKDGMP